MQPANPIYQFWSGACIFFHGIKPRSILCKNSIKEMHKKPRQIFAQAPDCVSAKETKSK